MTTSGSLCCRQEQETVSLLNSFKYSGSVHGCIYQTITFCKKILMKTGWQVDVRNGNKTYAGEESGEYGMLYVLLLRYIWQLFRNTEHYCDNSPENLMMWSYLWADQMMSTMMKSAVQHPADREHWLGGLQHMLGDIKTEGLHNRTKQGDPVSPETVNLYRICINGTLQLLSRYKVTQQVASKTIDLLLEKYPEWMETETYYREAKRQIADVIGSLQYAAPYAYLDRLRKMRIRLEIATGHVIKLE